MLICGKFDLSINNCNYWENQSFSAVVGPNGSGKSNVIDAMLFVFGKRAKQVGRMFVRFLYDLFVFQLWLYFSFRLNLRYNCRCDLTKYRSLFTTPLITRIWIMLEFLFISRRSLIW